jgi:hypothetical protein
MFFKVFIFYLFIYLLTYKGYTNPFAIKENFYNILFQSYFDYFKFDKLIDFQEEFSTFV